MGREIRIYLLAVGLPTLALGVAAVWLARIEMGRASRPRPAVSLRIDGKTTREQVEAYKREAFAAIDAASGCSIAGRKPLKVSFIVADRARPGVGVNRFAQAFSSDSYAPWAADAEECVRENDIAIARILWISGCVVGLMFLALVAGGWLLVRAARQAREESLKKTDFVSNITHEFKTPLTAICLCAELAQDDMLGHERRQKALKAIAAESKRLKELVINVLDFSRIEKNRREFRLAETDAVRVVRDVASSMIERFSRGLALPDGSCAVFADESALKQIVVILLDNAAKYAAGAAPVEVSISRERGMVAINVADRGPGLEREALKRVFDRFWRGDNALTAETGGSGLGLAIARELSKGMRGSLSARSRPGGGLVFTLRLPAWKEGMGA